MDVMSTRFRSISSHLARFFGRFTARNAKIQKIAISRCYTHLSTKTAVGQKVDRCHLTWPLQWGPIEVEIYCYVFMTGDWTFTFNHLVVRAVSFLGPPPPCLAPKILFRNPPPPHCLVV